MISTEELAAISARADAAYHGSWSVQRNEPDGFVEIVFLCPSRRRPIHVAASADPEAEFIAHARTDVPLLVDELLTARARLTELEAKNAHLHDGINDERSSRYDDRSSDEAPFNGETR